MIDWTSSWDDEIGLWVSSGPGHTVPTATAARVHSGPNAASRLLAAVQIGEGERVPVGRILTALRAMQVTEPGHFAGCCTWYWEEPEPVDTNAAFFTGQSLLVLQRCFADRLDAPSRTVLAEMLAGLRVWFSRCLHERMFHYPNKFLGDLVCGWLLQEEAGDDAARADHAAVMGDAADYWLHHGWGWGEHLSDIYARVCLDELSLLLLLSRALPADVRAQYEALFHNLLAIEDQFDGIPRVPALRSYAFNSSPVHRNYRDLIAPMPDNLTVEKLGNQPLLGPLFHELGWHQLAPPRAPRASAVTIPCFGGTTATAHIADDISLGSVSRFPVMPAAEHAEWGLAWQCFPVALWRPDGDWGFLQWSAREDGVSSSHPADVRPGALMPRTLTRQTNPPIVGQTYCLQRGGDLLVLRILPMLAHGWESFGDRFRLVALHTEPVARDHDGWSTLALPYPARTVSLACLPLTCTAPPVLTAHDNLLDWELTYTQQQAANWRKCVTVWGISLNSTIEHAPIRTPLPTISIPRLAEERAWRLEWAWPDTRWEVIIDPLAEEPLREG